MKGAWLGLAFASGLLCLAVVPAGCGANMQAVYEGDVRFEHCMALDARPEIRDAIRRACWVEWVRFYTYGQTRDRLVHAELRLRQLSLPDVGGAPTASAAGEPSAAPGASARAPAGSARDAASGGDDPTGARR